MAAPVVTFVATLVGGAILNRVVTPSLDAAFVMEPRVRASAYYQNVVEPNLRVGPDGMIQLYHCGYLGEPYTEGSMRVLRNALTVFGINMETVAPELRQMNYWGAFVHLQRKKPAEAEVITLWHQGRIGKENADMRLKELGYSRKIERDHIMAIETPLSADMVMDLYHRKAFDRAEADKRLLALGYISSEIRNKLIDRKATWSLPDIRTFSLRGDLTTAESDEYLRRLGYFTSDDLFLFDRSKPFIPPPSDLVRFAIKDIFDPNLPDKAGMLAEYAEQGELKEWFRIQGIGPYTFTASNGERIRQDVGEMYWIASFELPSPTQAYVMYQRLRPNRITRYKLGEEGGRPIYPAPVTLTDIRALLKDKDYRPGWRDRLAAISYLPVQKIDVGRLYSEGVYGEPLGAVGWGRLEDGSYGAIAPAEVELFEVMQDRGYSPYDASQLGYLQSLQYDRKKGGKQQRKTLTLLCQSYQLGAITRVTLINRLRATGQTELEAAAYADNCDLEFSVATLKKGIGAIRAAVLTGRIDAGEARRLLNQQQVVLPKIEQMLRLWAIELIAKQKELSAEKMCDWLGKGLLTQADMEQRLLRLGWRQEDVNRIIRHCILGHLARDASDRERLARREARERERIERELIRLRDRRTRDMERQEQRERQAAEKALQRLREGREPNKVKKYYRAGVISLTQIRSILSERGWAAIDIDRWVIAEL